MTGYSNNLYEGSILTVKANNKIIYEIKAEGENKIFTFEVSDRKKHKAFVYSSCVYCGIDNAVKNNWKSFECCNPECRRVNYNTPNHKLAQRTVTATDDIVLDVMRNGYALIPVREKNKIRARLARENLHYRFTQLDGRRVKVTPVKE